MSISISISINGFGCGQSGLGFSVVVVSGVPVGMFVAIGEAVVEGVDPIVEGSVVGVGTVGGSVVGTSGVPKHSALIGLSRQVTNRIKQYIQIRIV